MNSLQAVQLGRVPDLLSDRHGVLFFVLPHRVRWAHLLLASCVFYAFFVPIYLLILAFTIAVDYAAGIMIERSHDRTVGRPAAPAHLLASIIAKVGVLPVFKY